MNMIFTTAQDSGNTYGDVDMELIVSYCLHTV